MSSARSELVLERLGCRLLVVNSERGKRPRIKNGYIGYFNQVSRLSSLSRTLVSRPYKLLPYNRPKKALSMKPTARKVKQDGTKTGRTYSILDLIPTVSQGDRSARIITRQRMIMQWRIQGDYGV